MFTKHSPFVSKCSTEPGKVVQKCGGEGEGEKALQFKSELLRGVFGEERGGKREAELVVGRFVGEAKWCCRRQQLFNNKFDGSAVTALILILLFSSLALFVLSINPTSK